MTKKTKKKIKKALTWYLGPVVLLLVVLLLAGALSVASVGGYMAYQTLQVIKAEHELISNSLTGNCKAMLENQGFEVAKPKPPEPPEPEPDPVPPS